jgi:uncharacterized protein YggE
MIRFVRKAVTTCLLMLVPALLGGATSARGAETEDPIPVIRVTGRAMVTAAPDHATIQLGVVAQADSAERAARENAEKLDAALEAIRAALGPAAEIKTHGYSLHPDYRAPKPGGERKIVGYTATNVVQVDTGALDLVGKVVDVATTAGANELRSLRFVLKNGRDARAQAVSQAARNARAKADAIASALDLRVVRILSVDEGGPSFLPEARRAQRFLAAESAAAPTPIEPGTLEVHATVTITVEVKSLLRR